MLISKYKSKRAFLLFSVIVLAALPVFAQSNSVKVGNIDWGEVDFKGFALSGDTEVTIKGEAGYFDEWDDDLLFYGWILNSQSREVVWNLLEDSKNFKRSRRDGLFKLEEKLNLKAGDYEVYFTGMYDRMDNEWDLGDIIGQIFGSGKKSYRNKYKNDLGLTVSGHSSKFTGNDGKKVVDRMAKDAIVSFIRMGDDEYQKESFTVTADVPVIIYALGEGRRKSAYDYGWIYDEVNNKKVWEMNPRDGEHAGGGSKNICYDSEITLPKGTYTVHYVTDDSHSYRDWNVMPPFDPQFWGISIWVKNDGDMKNISKSVKIKEVAPIVDLTRVRDDEHLSQGLKVKSDVQVRVLCLGEAGNRKTMVDYGWIVNADNREVVWEMTWKKSDHAGGDEKNRMQDELITLKPANYIVYYVSDDSHSYRDWNASAPYSQDKWGISMWVTKEEDKNKIQLFDANNYRSDKIIAEIVRVRDDEYESKTFTLKSKTKVRIFAIGEGDERNGGFSRRKRGEMFDYGWIENVKTRNIVWEMTYDNTEHAGGAEKNRMFNSVIELEAGDYKLFYETDDSHSYRDWNDSPPHDADRYGITLLKE